ncbi:ATP-binding protein [Nitrospira sp. KM1]|uniref:ATP-binding protein n=1 Tax=Nitrospira sp. KM1 TaxID=1936990 RepID=UPI001564AC20|nr:ATP-binding protein [Nitrospira sp. KM1]
MVSSLHRLTPAVLTGASLIIFAADLYFPIGFVLWLPYFVLAFFVARWYGPETLLTATVLWSLAIMGEPFLPPHSGEPLSLAVINRSAGIATLWILAGLLYVDSRARRSRQQTEETLRQTTAFVESLFEHLPNMVFVKDAKDLRFVRVNKAGEDLMGLSRAELVGRNDYDFFPAEEADFFTAKDRETLTSGRLLDIPEESLRTRDGNTRLLHTKKIPLFDADGTPRYLLGISEDVTARKEAETTLVKARFAAERANKAKSDFLANMSHEMRTPLNAIMGISEYLLRSGLQAEQRELVKLSMKASDGLLRIIEDLLNAAKIESGTLELAKDPFILPEIVSETVAMLTAEANQKGLALKMELEPGLPIHVEGDAYRLRQVLLNLIRNAIKFTASGAVTVRVESSPEDARREMVRFTVTDTGIGIDPSHTKMIFDRFTQEDSQSNRHYGGAGLGLSICKQLVALMGGHIGVESIQGRGSAFAFTIPLRPVQAPQPSHETRPAPKSAMRQSSLADMLPPKGIKILLAEDSIESQQVIRLYLRNTPHQLQCAESGERVIEHFQSGSYDLIFMDLQMPDMDGLTATRLIREWELKQGRPRTPIVALTANGMNEARRESLEAGCNEFLTKPIKMDVILQTVQHYATATPQASQSVGQAVADFDSRSYDEALLQMKPKFLKNRRGDVEALQTALTERHFEQIAFIGHRMKGLAGSYQLDDIGSIGNRLEKAASAQDLQTVTELIEALAGAIGKAERAMESVTDTPNRSQ